VVLQVPEQVVDRLFRNPCLVRKRSRGRSQGQWSQAPPLSSRCARWRRAAAKSSRRPPARRRRRGPTARPGA
jgi:hypothetical protein